MAKFQASSTKRMVFTPFFAFCCAAFNSSRSSASPARAAESWRKHVVPLVPLGHDPAGVDRVDVADCAARQWAKEVFPQPGGPQRIMETKRSSSGEDHRDGAAAVYDERDGDLGEEGVLEETWRDTGGGLGCKNTHIYTQ